MANWELVIEGRQGAQDMLSVIHYQDNSAGAVNWNDAATVIRGHLTDDLISSCGNRTTWEGITVREDIPGGVGISYPFSAGVLSGTYPAADHADVLTMLIRKKTVSLVRPTAGWAQQGGFSAAGLEPTGVWATSFTGAGEAFWESIRVLNLIDDVVLQMVIKARNPTAPNTQAYTAVSSVSAEPVPRTQRSRLPEVGS